MTEMRSDLFSVALRMSANYLRRIASFGHTFARILPQKPGVKVRDVAELLSNTEEMIRKQ